LPWSCGEYGSNNPPLLLIAPPSAADDARDRRPALNDLRVVIDVEFNVHTIPDLKRIAIMHARISLHYVESELSDAFFTWAMGVPVGACQVVVLFGRPARPADHCCPSWYIARRDTMAARTTGFVDREQPTPQMKGLEWKSPTDFAHRSVDWLGRDVAPPMPRSLAIRRASSFVSTLAAPQAPLPGIATALAYRAGIARTAGGAQMNIMDALVSCEQLR
jgi:hypothetical protein